MTVHRERDRRLDHRRRTGRGLNSPQLGDRLVVHPGRKQRLLDEFEGASAGLVSVIGDLIIVDDDDERLSLTTTGFRAEVIPEDSDEEWRTLTGAEELVEFYDPTDVFGDLADALAEAFPAVAPELADASANGTGEGAEAAGDLEPEAAAADGDAEDEPTA